MTAPAKFTQADIRRAMKAVEQSGYPTARIILDPRGKMEIVISKLDAPTTRPEEDFDL